MSEKKSGAEYRAAIRLSIPLRARVISFFT